MNTEQKAREWLTKLTATKHEAHGVEIITALLAERQALLDALKVIVSEIDWRPAHRAIAMCEEQNNE